MANRTAWTAGSESLWTAAFLTTDFTTSESSSYLGNGYSVLSGSSAVANATNLDMFMDISMNLAISSSTIAAGANMAFWTYYLNEDGSTYGDGLLTASTAAIHTPAFPPCAVLPLYAAASQTTLVGQNQSPIPIKPVNFLLVCQNNSGFTLNGATQSVKIQTYNINLNN